MKRGPTWERGRRPEGLRTPLPTSYEVHWFFRVRPGLAAPRDRRRRVRRGCPRRIDRATVEPPTAHTFRRDRIGAAAPATPGLCPNPGAPCGDREDTRDDVVPIWLSHRPPWRSRGHRRVRNPEGIRTVRRLHAPSRTITSARHGMIGSVSPTLVTLAPSLPMSPVLPSTALAADTSLGVVQRSAPPSSRSRGSPLQVSTGCPASTFGREVPTSRLVPPSWFPTTSAAFSSRAARTCCSPLPTLGFIPFPTALPPSSPGCAPALRSLPSPCSDPERVQVWGAVTRSAIAGVPVHLLPCPPAVSVHTNDRPCGPSLAPWRYLGSLLPVVTRPTHLRALLHTSRIPSG